MVEAVGNEVVELARVRFGSHGLGGLPEGKARRGSALPRCSGSGKMLAPWMSE